MKGKVKLVLAFLALVCLGYAFYAARKDAASATLQRPSLLALAIVLYLAQLFFQAYGWHLILKWLKQPITLPQSFHLWFMGLMTRWIPGPLQWISRIFLAKEYGVSPAIVGFASVIELGYIILSALLVSLAFSASAFATLLGKGHGALASGIMLVFLAGLLAFVTQPSLIVSFLKLRSVSKIVKKMAKAEIEWDKVPVITTAQSLRLVGFYAGYWLISGLGFVTLAMAFTKVQLSHWPPYLAAFPASWFIGFLSIITPGGLGVREAALYFMLAPVTSKSFAVMLAVWSRIVMLISEASGVGMVLLATHKKLPQIHLKDIEKDLEQAIEGTETNGDTPMLEPDRGGDPLAKG